MILLEKEIRMSVLSGRKYKMWFAAILLYLLCVIPVTALILLGEFDWNPPDSSDGVWTSDHVGWVNLAYPTSGGNTGGFMSVEFPATAVPNPPNEWSEVIHSPATNLFAGTYTTSMWFEMDFWASNYVAGAVQFRWKSTTNAEVWRYTVTPPAVTQTWGTVSASLANWNDWKYVGASQAKYLSDLQDIQWIGVYIYRNTANEQTYGIDNFQLWIPEPAEYIMLAAAILTSGMSFRRRRRRRKAQRGKGTEAR